MTVRNGTVENFAAGVVLDGGGANRITGMTVDENIGPAGTDDLGDGILVNFSNDNVISDNTVTHNGPFGGITLLGLSGRNQIGRNTVTENNQPELCPNRDVFFGPELFCGPSSADRPAFSIVSQQDDGIRIEGEGPNGEPATGNTIFENRVTGSGNSGILATSICPDGFLPQPQCPGRPNSDNVIRGNVVNGNGFGFPVGPNDRMPGGPDDGGSGIELFAIGPNPPVRHTIEDNVVNGNARHGIVLGFSDIGGANVGANHNLIVGNSAAFNNAAPVGDPGCPSDPGNPGSDDCNPSFNGADFNVPPDYPVPCDANIWRDNRFGPITPDPSAPPNPADAPINHPCVAGNPPDSRAQAAAPFSSSPGPPRQLASRRGLGAR